MSNTTTEPNSGALIPNVGIDAFLFKTLMITALQRIGSVINKAIGTSSLTRVLLGLPLKTTACTIAATTGDVTFSAHDGTSVAIYQVVPPDGVNLLVMNLFVTPGAHTVLPTTPISMKLDYVDLGDGTTHALFASTPDPSATHQIYDVFHSFAGTVTGGGHTVNRSQYKYILTVVGENDGVNGVNGGLVRGITGNWLQNAGAPIGQD